MCDLWSALSMFPAEQSGKTTRSTSLPEEHRDGGEEESAPP
jgi:hypothetical protein